MASSTTSPAAAAPRSSTGGNSSVNARKADWFIASAATNHMTGDRTLISNMVPVSNQIVPIGDAKGMQVSGRGFVNTETVVLSDVWYVPGLTTNLVSVGQLTEDHPGLIVEIGGRMCRISKTSDGSVIGRAPMRSDRKYVVEFLKV